MDVYLAQSDGSGTVTLLMIVAMIAIFYFLLIRPGQRRRREHAELIASLTEGDQVVTIGGLHGTIAEVDDHTVVLETSEGVFARYERAAVARKLEELEQHEQAESESDSEAVHERDKD